MITRLVLLSLLLALVAGSHFRFGQITWERIPGNGQSRLVRFTLATAWRRTFFGLPNRGDIITESADFLPFQGGPEFGLELLVDTVNEGEDWVTATQIIEFDYPNDGFFTAFYQRCCRIGALVNNPNRQWRVQTQVRVSPLLQTSISSGVLPIVTAAFQMQSQFTLQVTNPDNLNLRFRLADPLIATINGDYDQVEDLIIGFESGIVIFDAPIRGLHSTQILIEAYRGPTPSNVNDRTITPDHSIVVDFILNVIDPSGAVCRRFCRNLGAVCAIDDNCFDCLDDDGTDAPTPDCDPNTAPFFSSIVASAGGDVQDVTLPNALGNRDVTAIAGEPFELVIVASDDDFEDFIEITSNGVPGNAMFDAPTLFDRMNPATATLTWTPPQGDPGFVFCVTAFDSLQNSLVGLTCIRISVEAGQLEASTPSPVVAGEESTVFITNSPNVDHTVTILGPMTNLSITVSEESPGEYEAVYNDQVDEVVIAGFYIVTVEDTDNDQNDILQLQIIPAATSAPDTLLFQESSSGLSSVPSNGQGSFFIQARDEFENNIDEVRPGEDFEVDIEFQGSVIQTVDAIRDPARPGVYSVTYDSPSVNVNSILTLRVFLVISGREPAGVVEVNILATPLDFEYSPRTFAAGEILEFNITVEEPANDPEFLITVLGEILPPSAVGAPISLSVNETNYPVTGPLLTLAGAFNQEDGIIVAVGGETDAETLVVVTGDPSGPNSILQGDFDGFAEAEAGEPEVITFLVQDMFGNRIIENVGVVTVTVDSIDSSVATQTIPGVFSNGVYVATYFPTLAGDGSIILTPTIDLAVAPNEVQQLGPLEQILVNVEAAEFDTQQSSLTGSLDGVAGEDNLFTITALDRFRNDRPPREDNFNLTVVQTNNLGEVVVAADVALPPGDIAEARYAIIYNTTVAGSYQLNLCVFLDTVCQTFISQTVTVNPGVGNLNNTGFGGDGQSGGLSGETVSIFINTQDDFGNFLVSADDDVFAVELLYSNQPPQRFLATFIGPIETRSTTTFEALQVDGAILEEGPANAHFRVDYEVPEIVEGVTGFTLQVYHLSFDGEDRAMLTADSVIENPDSTSFPTMSARADAPLGFLAANLEWVVAAFAGGAVLLSGFGYATFRLYRYKPKYKETRARAESAERALEEIAEEQNIIVASRDWDAVGGATVTANPLHDAYSLLKDPRDFENIESGETELVD